MLPAVPSLLAQPQQGEIVSSDPLLAALRQVAAHQDKAAFAHLFDYYAPRLQSYMQRLGTAPDQAEELVQEVMLTVWRKAAQFDPQKAALSTWIFTIARNRRVDALRQTKRPEVDLADPALVQGAELGQGYRADEQALLKEALAVLPPDQASLLQQAYFEDKTHQQMAADNHLPLGTVKSRLRLALEKMRHHLTLKE